MKASDNVLVVIFFVCVTIITIVASFAPDTQSQRIAACMTQPNMEFTNDQCVSITNTNTQRE
jgi:hypothetical protein